MAPRIVSPRRHAIAELRHMLRLLALATLACAASGAAQAWVSIGESESTAYYLDAETVRSDGSKRRVWRLFDLKQERDGVRSGKALIEIDCRRGTYRYLKTMYYSEPMGTGKYVGGRGQHTREHIAPGTMISQLATRVCEPAAQRAAAPGARPAALANAPAPVAAQPAAKK
jgi:hypothetical protein